MGRLERRIERTSNNCLYCRFSIASRRRLFALSTHHLSSAKWHKQFRHEKYIQCSDHHERVHLHDHQWSRHEFPGRARDAPRHWSTMKQTPEPAFETKFPNWDLEPSRWNTLGRTCSHSDPMGVESFLTVFPDSCCKTFWIPALAASSARLHAAQAAQPYILASNLRINSHMRSITRYERFVAATLYCLYELHSMLEQSLKRDKPARVETRRICTSQYTAWPVHTNSVIELTFPYQQLKLPFPPDPGKSSIQS